MKNIMERGEEQIIDQFGRYPAEKYALNIVFINRTGVASLRDNIWSIRIIPTEEQWKKIGEILNEK